MVIIIWLSGYLDVTKIPFLKTAICILSFVRPVKFIQVFAALGVTELFTFDRISFPLVQKGKAVPEQSKGNSSSWLKKQSLSKAGGTPSQIPQPRSVLVGEPD